MIDFDPADDVVFYKRQTLPAHPNGMSSYAYDAQGNELLRRTYYSVGGGFIVSGDVNPDDPIVEPKLIKYRFSSSADCWRCAKQHGISISTLMLESKSWRSEQIRDGLLRIWRLSWKPG